ncbi:unnamed protein product [Pleuronectes platessa]|uniref:Uncharacterized protein n=1 Tax=Pleuronectes platessa TaxID=8262 RepID=A0A9N7V3B8_PLEPL|nr:unnamed protein product [Pleuronectes platessa]
MSIWKDTKIQELLVMQADVGVNVLSDASSRQQRSRCRSGRGGASRGPACSEATPEMVLSDVSPPHVRPEFSGDHRVTSSSAGKTSAQPARNRRWGSGLIQLPLYSFGCANNTVVVCLSAKHYHEPPVFHAALNTPASCKVHYHRHCCMAIAAAEDTQNECHITASERLCRLIGNGSSARGILPADVLAAWDSSALSQNGGGNEMRPELTGCIRLPTGTGGECKGMFSGETQPQCMLGRRGAMTEKDLELLRGQPADSRLTSANTACQ